MILELYASDCLSRLHDLVVFISSKNFIIVIILYPAYGQIIQAALMSDLDRDNDLI
jgi:hypothetical protein